jgi:enamine deaminase RidA (YjgF/YER057c/UK114 family)
MSDHVMFERVSSHAMWENIVGYCRALKAGPMVFVTGTAPVDDAGTGVFAAGNAEAQARRCLELIERALAGFGLDRTRIARTRMYVTDISRWRDYGRAHAAFFGTHRPTTTMVEVKSLIDPAMLIEIEADAVA